MKESADIWLQADANPVSTSQKSAAVHPTTSTNANMGKIQKRFQESAHTVTTLAHHIARAIPIPRSSSVATNIANGLRDPQIARAKVGVVILRNHYLRGPYRGVSTYTVNTLRNRHIGKTRHYGKSIFWEINISRSRHSGAAIFWGDAHIRFR